MEKSTYLDKQQQILDILMDDPSHRNYWYSHKKLQKLEGDNPSPPVRYAVLSSHTIDLLEIYLDVDSRRIGLAPDVYIGPFNQYQQALMDDGSKFNSEEWDIVIIDTHLGALVSNNFLSEFPRLTEEERRDELEALIASINRTLELASEKTEGLILFTNFIVPTHTPFGILETKQELGYHDFVRTINRKLRELYLENNQVHIVDLDLIASEFGKSRVTDPKMYYRGTILYSEEFLPHLSHHFMGYVKALRNLNRKAIVLDLDNTLWGGIIGEDGIDGIKLNQNHPGKEFYEFQKYLKSLYNRGIILAANSKNNHDDAMEAIQKHPAMVLREEHFAAVRINWQDKVQNIIEIAEELNIGIDSLVFVDDNPVERSRVKSSLPEVLVVDMPKDPHEYLATIGRLNDFNTLSLTAEDLKRGEMYVARRKRKSLESNVQSMEEFIRSLEIRAIIKPADEYALPRVTSLVNRTNQFNVTTKRYTEHQIQEFYEDDGSMMIYTLQVTDKFGDEGIVGVAMVEEKDENTWEIVNFLMSCRVIGRKIETAFIAKIINAAHSSGIKEIRAEWIRTKKNTLVMELFDKHDFELISNEEDHKTYRYKVGGELDYPEFLTIVDGSEQDTN